MLAALEHVSSAARQLDLTTMHACWKFYRLRKGTYRSHSLLAFAFDVIAQVLNLYFEICNLRRRAQGVNVMPPYIRRVTKQNPTRTPKRKLAAKPQHEKKPERTSLSSSSRSGSILLRSTMSFCLKYQSGAEEGSWRSSSAACRNTSKVRPESAAGGNPVPSLSRELPLLSNC